MDNLKLKLKKVYFDNEIKKCGPGGEVMSKFIDLSLEIYQEFFEKEERLELSSYLLGLSNGFSFGLEKDGKNVPVENLNCGDN